MMKKRIRPAFALLPIAALTLSIGACSSADSSPAVAAVPNAATFSAGPFTVAASSELVMCTYVRGTNDVDADITKFESEQSLGGHHLIVYTIDHPVDLPPTLCSQGGQPTWSQVLVSQDKKDESAFPAGVGFHVKAHQQYVMETHYINTTSAPLNVQSSFTETFANVGEVTTRAATYFFGTMNINVAPNSASSQTVSCSPPVGVDLHTMFGHEHRHGTGVSVDLMAGGTAKPERIYETKQWDGPPIESFATGQPVAAADTVRVACDWQNEEATTFRYPHEMCFAIGYYWPAEAGIFCASGGGTDKCLCRYQGDIDSGPGGSTVEVAVTRNDAISGAKGDIDKGAPIYCALFRDEDWGGILPKAGAQPRYFRDSVDFPLTTTSDVAKLVIEDVTPGDYVATCLMDTIGGGFYAGSGDIVNVSAVKVTAVAGKTASIAAKLDFAVP